MELMDESSVRSVDNDRSKMQSRASLTEFTTMSINHDKDGRSNSSFPLEMLPDDILAQMIQWLSVPDVWELSLVNKRFYRLCNGANYWKPFIQEHFHVPRSVLSETLQIVDAPNASWKTLAQIVHSSSAVLVEMPLPLTPSTISKWNEMMHEVLPDRSLRLEALLLVPLWLFEGTARVHYTGYVSIWHGTPFGAIEWALHWLLPHWSNTRAFDLTLRELEMALDSQQFMELRQMLTDTTSFPINETYPLLPARDSPTASHENAVDSTAVDERKRLFDFLDRFRNPPSKSQTTGGMFSSWLSHVRSQSNDLPTLLGIDNRQPKPTEPELILLPVQYSHFRTWASRRGMFEAFCRREAESHLIRHSRYVGRAHLTGFKCHTSAQPTLLFRSCYLASYEQRSRDGTESERHHLLVPASLEDSIHLKVNRTTSGVSGRALFTVALGGLVLGMTYSFYMVLRNA
jgi:hypothetical protein